MDNKKISQNREKKSKIIARLSDKLRDAKGLVFTNYQGLAHKQLEELKKKLKTMDADMVVAKNTLLKIALNKSESFSTIQKDEENSLEQPTATLLLYKDPIAPLKELAKMIKELNLPAIKFGILDNQRITDKEILKLSTLPSRDTLIAQLMGIMKGPISGLHRSLNWNMQKFVLTLKAIESKKSTSN